MKIRPIKFAGALKDFEEGQLCYVVARRHRGKGPVKLLLHKAVATGPDQFGYPVGQTWIVSPGSLLACGRSKAKSAAARANGRKGGRPRKIKT